jgi:prolyl 4-hydroxylase
MSGNQPRRNTASNADQAAIARAGAAVRARLAADPSVYQVPVEGAELFAAADFLSKAECASLVAMIDRLARPSPTFDGHENQQYRTSYSADVDRGECLVRMIERRICDLLGLDEAWGETMQGQRYAPGQEFKGHYDWFNIAAPYWPKEVKRGGQRCWTAMIYLNDVEEGGETHFSQLGISIPPQAGMLLTWNNAAPDGTQNPAVMHAGTPVVRGVKYIVTKWFRTRRWR